MWLVKEKLLLWYPGMWPSLRENHLSWHIGTVEDDWKVLRQGQWPDLWPLRWMARRKIRGLQSQLWHGAWGHVQHGDLSGHDRHWRLHRSNGQLLLARWAESVPQRGDLKVHFFVSNFLDPLAACILNTLWKARSMKITWGGLNVKTTKRISFTPRYNKPYSMQSLTKYWGVFMTLFFVWKSCLLNMKQRKIVLFCFVLKEMFM